MHFDLLLIFLPYLKNVSKHTFKRTSFVFTELRLKPFLYLSIFSVFIVYISDFVGRDAADVSVRQKKKHEHCLEWLLSA